VFALTQPTTRDRLSLATGVELADAGTLRRAIGELFRHFLDHEARACAISLPPDFEPCAVGQSTVEPILQALLSDRAISNQDALCVSRFVFWTLAEMCAEHRLPFDLMIGVNRRVYPGGVYQGQDLFDSRTSLIQYRHLFNAFPQVTFPVSVLSHGGNQELVAWSWIFPNVVTNGHWWYSNIPSYIELDCKSRLEAVPRTKQIGYYSDMYKLEFALPKFNMYRRILAGVLAEDFVMRRSWTEERAVRLGTQVLRGNVERVFNVK
jgi:glucuronate isomerase